MRKRLKDLYTAVLSDAEYLLLHNGEVEIGQTQSGKPMASVSAILLEPVLLKLRV